MKRKWTDEQLIEAVKNQRSYSGVTRELGISNGSGGAIANIKAGIQRLQLDITHWELDLYRTETTKRCSHCKEFKPFNDFFNANQTKDGKTHICKPCKREVNLLANWAKSHGLTLEDYAALLEVQHGLCSICEKDSSGTRWNRLYVDHDHITNKPRGLLCSNCNLVLGKFGDDADLFEKAANYLRRF